MWRKKDRDAVPAGEIRGEFGLALDKLLPKPELRHRFRVWRHTRPFWAGVFVIVSGLIIISYPLGPWPAMMAIGASALTGIVIGLVLIVGGLFFWFSPHQRSFVSIILMLCSVLSFVASNLGGFFLGMILGMIGSAWGFGWKQPKAIAPTPAPRSPKPDAPSSDAPSSGSPSSKTASAFVAVAMLAATFVVTGQSSVARAAGGGLHLHQIPSVGCNANDDTSNVSTSYLTGHYVRLYLDPTTAHDGCGHSAKNVDLFIPKAELSNYQLRSPSDNLHLGTDLQIFNIELLTTKICIKNLKPTDLISSYVDTSTIPIVGSVLDKVLSQLTGLAMPGGLCITPDLVKTLKPILETAAKAVPGLVKKDKYKREYFVIKHLGAPANWHQTYIRGDVSLSPGSGRTSIKVSGGPPAH